MPIGEQQIQQIPRLEVGSNYWDISGTRYKILEVNIGIGQLRVEVETRSVPHRIDYVWFSIQHFRGLALVSSPPDAPVTVDGSSSITLAGMLDTATSIVSAPGGIINGYVGQTPPPAGDWSVPEMPLEVGWVYRNRRSGNWYYRVTSIDRNLELLEVAALYYLVGGGPAGSIATSQYSFEHFRSIANTIINNLGEIQGEFDRHLNGISTPVGEDCQSPGLANTDSNTDTDSDTDTSSAAEVISKFAVTEPGNVELLLPQIRCGLEFEYHSVDGGEEDITSIEDFAHMAEIGTDSSVRGGELRTLGPRTAKEFLELAKWIGETDFEVGVDTSFHIHLSLPGVQHVYGRRFQSEMYAYLLQKRNWRGRMPDSVRKRTRNKNGGLRWANFLVSNSSKYVAIYKHSLNTWEFRLFGNVSTYEDMERCLHLAVEALQHAYRVKLGLEHSLLHRKGIVEIERIFQRVVSDRKFHHFEKYVSGELPVVASSLESSMLTARVASGIRRAANDAVEFMYGDGPTSETGPPPAATLSEENYRLWTGRGLEYPVPGSIYGTAEVNHTGEYYHSPNGILHILEILGSGNRRIYARSIRDIPGYEVVADPTSPDIQQDIGA